MKRRLTAHPFAQMRRRSINLFASAGLAAAFASVVVLAAAYGETAFPFGRELTAEVAPMPGTQRQPTLDIDDNGVAELDLWCTDVKTRLVVVADTITVVIGPKTERACPPDQVRADADMLAALAAVTNWRLDEDVLVLTGGAAPLRFRIQTN